MEDMFDMLGITFQLINTTHGLVAWLVLSCVYPIAMWCLNDRELTMLELGKRIGKMLLYTYFLTYGVAFMLVAELNNPDKMWLGILIGITLPLADIVVSRVRKLIHTAEVQIDINETNEV